jgi:hypothetical protein
MAVAPLIMHGPVDSLVRIPARSLNIGLLGSYRRIAESLGREVPAVSERVGLGTRKGEVESAGEVSRLGRVGRGQPRGPVSIANGDRY